MPQQTAESVLAANVKAAIETYQSLAPLAAPLGRAVELITACLTSGHKLLSCGNGGSAADASHFATEFVSRFSANRKPFPAIALTDFGSTITAIGNDYAFEQVFARQVRAFGQRGDVLVCFTTSGQSRDILLALEAAKEVGVQSVCFLGKGGGFTRGVADVELIVPGQVTARIQEAHLVLYHSLCEMVDKVLVTL